MDTFQLAPSEMQQPLQPHSFTVNMIGNRAQHPPQTDYNICQWTTSPGGYDSHPYGYRPPSSGLTVESCGRPHGYAFDPSVPPPPFACPPPGHFLPTVNTAHPAHPAHPSTQVGPVAHPSTQVGPVAHPSTQVGPVAHPGTQVGPLHTYNKFGSADIPKVNQHSTANSGFNVLQQREYPDVSERYGGHLSYPTLPPALPPPQGHDSDQRFGKTVDTQPVEEKATQRREDEQWVRRFFQSRGRASMSPQQPQQPQQPHGIYVPQIRETLHGAVRLISELSLACETLQHNLEDESIWMDSYRVALGVKRELQEKLQVLDDWERIDDWKIKLSRIAKRRDRRWRRKLLQMEDKHMEGQIAEKEAAIDKWRMKKIQEVEEKKMERELKMAADSVLGEVRKKQADVKRMQDVLRSLEKLRKLRKEAASRKGIFPDQESDSVFNSRLEQLRAVMRKRTTVYSAEEKALRVMLEGEQEEERRRDAEKRQRKERERQQQRKQEMDTILFGDEMPAEPPLQPFREYYTQAEHSLPALVQIRREWDVFLVAVVHGDGAAVPQDWVLPDPPSDHAWASILHNADTHSDRLYSDRN